MPRPTSVPSRSKTVRHRYLDPSGPLVALALCSATCFLSTPACAATLRVGPGAPYEDVQTAVDSAAAGDTLLLADGVYLENPLIVRKDLVLHAEHRGQAVIDAGRNGLAALRTVSSWVRITGLVLRNGIEPYGAGVLQFGGRVELRRCVLEDNQVGAWSYRGTANPGTLLLEECQVHRNGVGVEGSVETQIAMTQVDGNVLGVRCSGAVDFSDLLVGSNGGAGILNTGALALGGCYGRLRRCIVRGNWSDNFTGGMWLSRGPFEVEDCEITNNVSTGGPSGIGFDLLTEGSVRRCVVRGNRARGPMNAAAGLLVLRSNVTIEDCTIENNDSEASGGGLSVGQNSVLRVERCRINGNSTRGHGGGVWIEASQARLNQIVIAGNSAPGAGGIKLENNATLWLTHSTVAANRADAVGVLATFASRAAISSSIIAFNSGNPALLCDSGVSLQCVDLFSNGPQLQCSADGSGNLEVDPLFCGLDASAGRFDVRLQNGSPVADGECGLLGAQPVGCTSTAVQPVTWSQLKRLYDVPARRP